MMIRFGIVGLAALATGVSAAQAGLSITSVARLVSSDIFMDDPSTPQWDDDSASIAVAGPWHESVTAEASLSATHYLRQTNGLQSEVDSSRIWAVADTTVALDGVDDSVMQRGYVNGISQMQVNFQVTEPTEVMFWYDTTMGTGVGVYLSGPGVEYDVWEYRHLDPTPLTLMPGDYVFSVKSADVGTRANYNWVPIEYSVTAEAGIQVVPPPGTAVVLLAGLAGTRRRRQM